jgi:hypothetical protein
MKLTGEHTVHHAESITDADTPAMAEDHAIDLMEKIQSLILGAEMSQAIAVAAELRIADLLAQGPLPLHFLATATACDPGSLRRLLRALAGMGLCSEAEDETVRLLPRGALLRSDSNSMLGAYAIWWGRHRWPAWGNLLHSVRTGHSAPGTLSGRTGMKELDGDAGAAQVFHGAMVSITRVVASAVLRTHDFSHAQRVVDVGGGYGELLSVVLGAYPRLRGVLYDLPHALGGANGHLSRSGVLERCDIVGGNFFEAVPVGADTYLLKAVIHDWSDAESVTILRRCREACAPSARLLLVEQVLPERIEPCVEHQRATLADLNMLVMLGGRERTADEFRKLIESAGFALDSIRPAALGYSVLDARAC